MDEQQKLDQTENHLRLITLSPGIWTFKVEPVRAAVATPTDVDRSSPYERSDPPAPTTRG
jgi:hypothetical protein